MKTFGIIMAGGGGTRFWPLSRKRTPKQLLNLSGKEVMVNETVDRISTVCKNEDIYIVTNSLQAEKMQEVTEGRILPKNILREPSARNTAACIGYAAIKIAKDYGDGVMVITPSDAYVKDTKTFTKVLQTAINAAASSQNLITVGITPTFPATGYGYIKYKEADCEVKSVDCFVEKPNLENAKKYLESGNYVWNSGIFVWKASVILEKFKNLLPDIYSDLLKIEEALNTVDEEKILNAVYPQIRSISIDYGVMEKSDNILVVPGEFGWNDVGSWDMLGVLHEADENGNVCVGNSLNIDTKNTTVYSSGKLIACVGVEDMVIVETADAILVCPKNRVQDVKLAVEALKEKGKEELL